MEKCQEYSENFKTPFFSKILISLLDVLDVHKKIS